MVLYGLDSSLGYKLAAWPGPDAGEWNYIQLAASQKWGSPGLSVGVRPV